MKSALLLIVALGFGCSDTPIGMPEEGFEVLHERSLEDEAPVADINSLVEGNTDFAIELYGQMPMDENIILSPFSVSRTFSWFQKGEYLQDVFEGVFRYLPDPNATKAAFNSLGVKLMDRDQADERMSVFESRDIQWLDTSRYTDEARPEGYDNVHAFDFAGDPEYAREVINTWIEERSRGLLTDFLDPGLINPDTVSVTTNTIFFVGNWVHDYEERSINFSGRRGTKAVPGFGNETEYQHHIGEDYTMVRIPYTGEYSMVAVMPENIHSFRESLNFRGFRSILENSSRGLVRLSIPNIKTESQPDLVKAIDTLRANGGYNTTETITGEYMETYVHKVVINADKDGTTAAAATVVIGYDNNAPEPEEPRIINFDKPFIYFIIDDATKSILFVGHFVE